MTLTLLCEKLGRRMPTRKAYDPKDNAMMQVGIVFFPQ